MYTRRPRGILAATLLALLLGPAHAGLAGHPQGSHEFRGRPDPGADGDGRKVATLFVHGFSRSSRGDCRATWGSMIEALRGFGQAGQFVSVKYYGRDANCGHDISHHGPHRIDHHAAYHRSGEHTNQTDIRHLGFHLAWYLYDHFSRDGTPVQIVAHSMGGLVVRYALAQVERNTAGYPDRLLVEDVVTLGTPHAGAYWTCDTDRCSRQQQQMHPESDFVRWLARKARHPDPDSFGFLVTDWTVIGSYNDVDCTSGLFAIVSVHSATAMPADAKVVYWGGPNNRPICHGDYMRDTADTRDAEVYWRVAGEPYFAWQDAPHVVRWADLALYHGEW